MSSAKVTITIYQDPVINVSQVPTQGKAGTAYSGQVTAKYGKTPYKFSVDVLPDGLSLDATTGAITGTPTTGQAVTSTFTVAGAV